VIERGAPLPVLGPDPGSPAALRLVGRYALGVDWADGHQSIYPFELLRRACPCAACAAGVDLAADGRWPAAIRRDGADLCVEWADGHASRLSGRALRQRCPCAACVRGPR
jgi:DUF971 family protein